MIFRGKQKTGPKCGFPRVFFCLFCVALWPVLRSKTGKTQPGAAPEHLELSKSVCLEPHNFITFNGAERGGAVSFRGRREQNAVFPPCGGVSCCLLSATARRRAPQYRDAPFPGHKNETTGPRPHGPGVLVVRCRPASPTPHPKPPRIFCRRLGASELGGGQLRRRTEPRAPGQSPAGLVGSMARR